jgi:hypothetical protein
MLNGSRLAEFIRRQCRPKSGGTRMDTKIIRLLLVVGVATVALLVTFGLVSQADTPAKGNNVFSLKAPPFVEVASAEGAGPQAIASFLDDEAGISAYFSTTGPIDLQATRAAFRTIEVQTSDYIIGSVAVTDYPESEDVHVYVHKDGWFLAYYLKADPTGKIFDWRRYTTSAIPTKFEKALSLVAGQAGVPIPVATFYDFRYPNATHLMLIAEDINNGNQFQVNLPSTFTYYDRSWSLGIVGTWMCYGSATWDLDGVTIQTHSGVCSDSWFTSQGTLTAAQLTVSTFHTVTVEYGSNTNAWGGLALTYKVP